MLHAAPDPCGELPGDLTPVATADGSSTLDSRTLAEHYHSLHGAATESRHVYIAQGLRPLGMRQADVLEVGLGTGLNALLTWGEAEHMEISVDYRALEPCPLPWNLVAAMEHPKAIGRPDLAEGFRKMMDAEVGTRHACSPAFRFRRDAMRVQQLEVAQAYDLVYYDAFAPGVQPAMWTVDVFQRLHRAMRPGAVLVTYCAKGDVFRAMKAAGLRPRRVQGPPGKHRMIRAERTP